MCNVCEAARILERTKGQGGENWEYWDTDLGYGLRAIGVSEFGPSVVFVRSPTTERKHRYGVTLCADLAGFVSRLGLDVRKEFRDLRKAKAIYEQIIAEQRYGSFNLDINRLIDQAYWGSGGKTIE